MAVAFARNLGLTLSDTFSVIADIVYRALDFVVPLTCVGCDATIRGSALWCAECDDSVGFATLRQHFVTEQGYRVVSPYVYGGPVAAAVHRFKYLHRPELAHRLARPVAERVCCENWARCVLVPVPSTAERIAERGYNQSALLASAIASLVGLVCMPLGLKRVHFAPHQVGADKAHRRQQVAGAFAVNSRRLTGANVILVDDVITTGATSAACAAALESGGANVVAIAAIARVE